jgi:hypothetical protein
MKKFIIIQVFYLYKNNYLIVIYKTKKYNLFNKLYLKRLSPFNYKVLVKYNPKLGYLF